jgi:hypothetical protein
VLGWLKMENLTFVRGKKPSTKTYQLRRALNKRERCCICKNIFDKKDIQIEHDIPVSIGGDVDSYNLYCDRCHKPKTEFDLGFIAFLKKRGILVRLTPNHYLIKNREEVLEIYKRLRKLDNLDNLDS